MVATDGIEAYRKHKNLKLAAAEIGVKWQSLYVHLRKAGEPVIGDKARFGSIKDRLSASAEREFLKAVPLAVDRNKIEWQSKYDFDILGMKVDVKSAKPRFQSSKSGQKRWAFCFKKQTLTCDFVCCFCYGDDGSIVKILLVPSELFRGVQTVSVSCSGVSKWLDYEIKPEDLAPFFSSMAEVEQ